MTSDSQKTQPTGVRRVMARIASMVGNALSRATLWVGSKIWEGVQAFIDDPAKFTKRALGAVVILVSIAIVIGFVRLVYSGAVIVSVFSVSPKLQARGYTPESTTAQILDRVRTISNESATWEKRIGVLPVSDIPDLDISETKVSLSQLITYAERFVGFPVHELGGDLFTEDGNIVLIVRASDRHRNKAYRVEFPDDGKSNAMHAAINQAAEKFWEFNQPFILASYLYSVMYGNLVQNPDYLTSDLYKQQSDHFWNTIRICMTNLDDDDDARAINLAAVVYEYFNHDEARASALYEYSKTQDAIRDFGIVNSTDLQFKHATGKKEKSDDLATLQAIKYRNRVPYYVFRNLSRYESDPDVGNYQNALSDAGEALKRLETNARQADMWDKASLFETKGKALLGLNQQSQADAMYTLGAILDPRDTDLEKFDQAVLQKTDPASPPQGSPPAKPKPGAT